MSSPCLTGGGRTLGFELDLVKASSPLSRSLQSSSPSSTISESSSSQLTISNKKPRTPRKRPNQSYNEAAALLSFTYPSIFSSSSLRHHPAFPHESPPLLPPFPNPSDSAFLLHEPSPEQPSFRIQSSSSPTSFCVASTAPQPIQVDAIEDDFDAESLLDEEPSGEGIDSIFGDNPSSLSASSCVNPCIASLMGFGLRFNVNLRRALKKVDDGDWWRSPRVAVNDILPKFKALSASPPLEKSKKKKKVEKEETKPPLDCNGGKEKATTLARLNLKLDYSEVMKCWADKDSPFGDSGLPESSADDLLMDLFLETENGVGGGREACVQRYKEKRRTRLFSKKIRYQVRKVNADRRPRMKASGRFVKSPALLHETMEVESL
ncbi:protein CHLOROPLAST IMPORT APPARATUS 2-like isoform X1 [Dioscorea cayenensis subsp. rotundata]|uniref:Protein CHLOROPLAST IMPORT APPARATUS 2-like isoform X1 n=1 Tax=Dioscorea cayennensis subsp. rotundata TaxID=55577 RepID=A0AB40AY38_DIOCR|nr:protein CHLOROPLAST IMPORT APPARATUS 2-like isoform X1 [Dioscorea cayenensis subsp. rotundata]